MGERSYTTMDKSGWGEGPWQLEPDKVQFTDADTGLPCLIKRGNPHLGFLCGYVGVPPGHPWHGQDDAPVDVHGGITYTSGCQEGPEETAICHIPEPGESDDVWWFGFDCGHMWDLAPAMRAREKRDMPELLREREPQDVYRDIGYVRDQCRYLARQLAHPDQQQEKT